MPGNDGTGPDGKGPMTGRGKGKCNSSKNINNELRGQGLRRRANQ